MLNLGTNFKITNELQSILNIEAKRMLNENIDEVRVGIPGTKIKINLIKEKIKENYIDTLYKEINIDENIFYLAR